MVERVWVDLVGGQASIRGAVFRYEVLERLWRCAKRQGVTVLAFGFGEVELRAVVEGEDDAIRNTLRGLKVGTIRSASRWNLALTPGVTERDPVEAGGLLEAVAWAHMAPAESTSRGPLASVWSSHRDVLGFRLARFYDPSVLDGRVDPRALHTRCGGQRLPDGWPPPAEERESLSALLRIAGSVLGVLPADRRCFRLFVHLARARGWATTPLANALALTTRRVRQLAAADEPHLDLALATLGDARLARVP